MSTISSIKSSRTHPGVSLDIDILPMESTEPLLSVKWILERIQAALNEFEDPAALKFSAHTLWYGLSKFCAKTPICNWDKVLTVSHKLVRIFVGTNREPRIGNIGVAAASLCRYLSIPEGGIRKQSADFVKIRIVMTGFIVALMNAKLQQAEAPLIGGYPGKLANVNEMSKGGLLKSIERLKLGNPAEYAMWDTDLFFVQVPDKYKSYFMQDDCHIPTSDQTLLPETSHVIESTQAIANRVCSQTKVHDILGISTTIAVSKQLQMSADALNPEINRLQRRIDKLKDHQTEAQTKSDAKYSEASGRLAANILVQQVLHQFMKDTGTTTFNFCKHSDQHAISTWAKEHSFTVDYPNHQIQLFGNTPVTLTELQAATVPITSTSLDSELEFETVPEPIDFEEVQTTNRKRKINAWLNECIPGNVTDDMTPPLLREIGQTDSSELTMKITPLTFMEPEVKSPTQLLHLQGNAVDEPESPVFSPLSIYNANRLANSIPVNSVPPSPRSAAAEINTK